MGEVWVLAFDIETTGSRPDNGDIIAIGACVMNSQFEKLSGLFLKGYFPAETVFEKRCKEEFWDKNIATLKHLTYDGPLGREERKKEMICEFQGFRSFWEKKADSEGIKFALCSDNNVFDGGFINDYIWTYTSTNLCLPIPYRASDQKYAPFWETHAQQRGLLMAADPEFKGDWGLTKRIAELYEVPECPVLHDHDPSNDAYTIAFEQQVLLGIRDGRIKRRAQ